MRTNGKVERFNLSLKWEWAYARAYVTNASRTEELARWLHQYNYHRPHMALSGRAPITAVNNVPRKHTLAEPGPLRSSVGPASSKVQ